MVSTKTLEGALFLWPCLLIFRQYVLRTEIKLLGKIPHLSSPQSYLLLHLENSVTGWLTAGWFVLLNQCNCVNLPQCAAPTVWCFWFDIPCTVTPAVYPLWKCKNCSGRTTHQDAGHQRTHLEKKSWMWSKDTSSFSLWAQWETL